MPDPILRNPRLATVDAAHAEAIHAEFAPAGGKSKILASADYVGPVSVEQYLAWQTDDDDSPLAKQLRAALTACGQSTPAIAAATGVPQPVLQRFLSGHRSITLNTAGKLSAYLKLSLQPTPAASAEPQ